MFDLTRLLRENPGASGVHDYASGRRVTARVRVVDRDASLCTNGSRV
jgi:hypothetical protein